MVTPVTQENARGLAIPAFVIVCIWALLTTAMGVGFLMTAPVDSRTFAPIGAPDPVDPLNSWQDQIGILLMLGWLSMVNGMLGAALMGSIAIRRARAGWGRVVGYLGALIAGVGVALWEGLHDLVNADNPPTAAAKVTSGLGLLLIAVAVVAILRWLLKPALARALSVVPPPDPSTLLYSDSTT